MGGGGTRGHHFHPQGRWRLCDHNFNGRAAVTGRNEIGRLPDRFAMVSAISLTFPGFGQRYVATHQSGSDANDQYDTRA